MQGGKCMLKDIDKKYNGLYYRIVMMGIMVLCDLSLPRIFSELGDNQFNVIEIFSMPIGDLFLTIIPAVAIIFCIIFEITNRVSNNKNENFSRKMRKGEKIIALFYLVKFIIAFILT